MNFALVDGLRRFSPLLLAFAAAAPASAQFGFTELTQLRGYDLAGISGDGGTVFGSSASPGFGRPLYYQNGQVTFLTLGGIDGNGIARSAALDGTIAGQIRMGTNQSAGDAAVWRNGVRTLLERVPGGTTADARAISPDGHVVVGSAGLPTFKTQPARWVDGHVEPLGDIPGSDSFGKALAVSADGSVIVGEAGGNSRAFRWMNGTMEALPLISADDIQTSVAFDVSSDGRRVVGVQSHFNFLTDGLLREDGVARNLGYLPGTNRNFPYAISGDGELVFGECGTSLFNFRAFVWDDSNGIQDLMQVLSTAGVDFHGWTRLAHIIDVSADGHTILGYGDNAQGDTAYFLATIPEPGTLSLSALSFVLFGIRRGRGR